ncbi:MAG: VWA domain-containing protein [Myxococcaceae bacterium]|nr:VWA domain-containing protein [Myxococcaceae bacterium]
MRAVRIASALAFLALVTGACTDTYLYDERRLDKLPADRAIALDGDFCTPSTNDVVRPIKILLAMDASQSMIKTDPGGSRATALVELMNTLPQDPEISLLVMLFAGSTSAYLTKTGLGQFDRLIDYTPADKQALEQRLLNFAAPGTMANRDSTDFVKPLADIYEIISRDIANTRLMTKNTANDTRARYSVIFLSDGEPTNNQDDELLCGDAVRRVRQLKDLADDVKVNTVHVFRPTQPIDSTKCDIDGGTGPVGGSACRIPIIPPGACPLLQVNQDAERLLKMSEIGGGDFRDFRNNEPINFLNFRFGQVRRTFELDTLVASNFSALPGSPDDQADTDSDGLSDQDEATEMTNPWVRDTDGDGFSDGVEVHFRALGGAFTPNNMPLPDGGGLDPGCPPALRGVDTDCDGLLDCDEQIIGTNAQRVDSDDDGIPDMVEWQMQTQPSGKDLGQDPDTDGLSNHDELLMHMDPHTVDNAKLTAQGYRYGLVRSGPLDDQGRQCFHFRVDNVLLAPTIRDTRDAGNPDGGAPLFRRAAGYNDVWLSTAMKPGDDPTGRTVIRSFRTQLPRYPVGGIKLPVDGVVTVKPEDFILGCGPQQ